MAELITNYYDEMYDDMDTLRIESIKKAKEYQSIDEVPPENINYQMLQLLSSERANIIRWYPIKEDANVLEVGMVSPIVTSELCDKTASVVSIDTSMEACLYNQRCNQERENLMIIAGVLNHIQGLQQYDYIILNDSFCRAPQYVGGKHSYSEMLTFLKTLLKEDGHLLLSMENRIGLQYFAGAAERCSNLYFEGINQYPHGGERTFSKSEMEQLLSQGGYQGVQFYYPYPNHIFSNEIFTAETMKTNGYGRDYYNYQAGNLSLFQESIVAKDLLKEDVMEAFANAFFIDATFKREKDSVVTYAKINSDRKEEFRIVTTIEVQDGNKKVYKRALTKKAWEHLKQMCQYEQEHQDGKYQCLSGTWENGQICYAFLENESLDAVVEPMLAKHQSVELLDMVQQLFDDILPKGMRCKEEIYTEQFQEYFGKYRLEDECECIKDGNIDLILGNIIPKNDSQYYMIDNEWVIKGMIPRKFIVWRCLNEIMNGHLSLCMEISREDILKHFQITTEEEKVFGQWNRHFTEVYVQANQMRKYALEKKTITLEQEIQQPQKMESKLYIDYGEGFQEEHTLQCSRWLERGRFEHTFYISDASKVKALRWDPVEQRACRCSAFAGEMKEKMKPLNAVASDERWDKFVTLDSQYQVNIHHIKDGRLIIRGAIEYLTYAEAEQLRFDAEKNGNVLGKIKQTFGNGRK